MLQAPSLWHEMQQREEDAADERQQEGGSPSRQDATFQAGALESGLFSGGGDAAAPLWGHVRLPLQHATAAAARRHPARLLAGRDAAKSPESTGLAATTHLAADAVAASARTRSAEALGANGPAPVGQRSSGGEVSGSIVRSVFDAVRSGFNAVGRALLPPSLHKLLDGENKRNQFVWNCYGAVHLQHHWPHAAAAVAA